MTPLNRTNDVQVASNAGHTKEDLASIIGNRLLAGFGLLLASPLLGLAALAILFDDGAPVFFRQSRVGQFGRPFQIVKLRTMVHGKAAGPAVTQGGDPRVTAVGGLLRKYKIDELPQLFNILRGDMAFVGPRPEVPRFVDLSDESWREVLRAKPGITHEVTLLLRNEEEVLAGKTNPDEHYRDHLLPLKLSLYRQRISNQSVFRQLKILLFTIYYAAFPSRFNPASVHRHLALSGVTFPPDTPSF